MHNQGFACIFFLFLVFPFYAEKTRMEIAVSNGTWDAKQSKTFVELGTAVTIMCKVVSQKKLKLHSFIWSFKNLLRYEDRMCEWESEKRPEMGENYKHVNGELWCDEYYKHRDFVLKIDQKKLASNLTIPETLFKDSGTYICTMETKEHHYDEEIKTHLQIYRLEEPSYFEVTHSNESTIQLECEAMDIHPFPWMTLSLFNQNTKTKQLLEKDVMNTTNREFFIRGQKLGPTSVSRIPIAVFLLFNHSIKLSLEAEELQQTENQEFIFICDVGVGPDHLYKSKNVSLYIGMDIQEDDTQKEAQAPDGMAALDFSILMILLSLLVVGAY